MADMRAYISELMEYGFNEHNARSIVRLNEIPLPFTENERRNLAMLKEYGVTDLNNREHMTQLMLFIRRKHEVNVMMAGIPDRYGFTAEQRRKYNSSILDWQTTTDLKEDLDETLALIVSDPEKRMDIYRGMYCNGVWWDNDTIKEICNALIAIAPDRVSLEKCVLEWWWRLFAYYCGTIQYIEALKSMFVYAYVWEIFSKTVTNVSEFSIHFNIRDDRERILEELAEKFPKYLR